jgi:signal transduction histidine kinase/sensor domain CHASE-containing protein
MTLVSRTSLLSVVAVMVAILGVLFFVGNDRIVLRELREQNIVEKKTAVDSIFKMKSDILFLAIEDYSTWEELARYVSAPKRQWAKDNIDSILGVYKAQGYWVYDAHGSLVSSLLRSGGREVPNLPFPATLPPMNGSVMLPRQFYSETATGIVEVYLASIHPSVAQDRSGPVQGYFIFTRDLDAAYLQELSELTRCAIEVVRPGQVTLPASEYQDGELLLRRPLTDHRGQQLRLLQARTPLPAINRLQQHNQLHGGAGMLFVLFFVGAMAQLVRYQQTLRRATTNLDEAQQLAKMGSWEREIGTGAGYWSENCFRLFHLAPRRQAPNLEELFTLIHTEDRQRVREHLLAAMANGHKYEIEFRLAHDNGQRVFRSIGTPVCDDAGKPVRLIGSVQDITEKLQQEQAKDQLLQQKEMFITRLSHDIKTPLTPLVALLPQIRRKVTDERLAGMLDLCLDSVNHIKSLVVKTIKLARFSSPAQQQLAELSLLPLRELVTDYLRKRSDLLTRAAVHTDVDIDPAITVMADQLELEEVFYNLITNAVKYAPNGSLIAITAERDAGMVTVRVRDNGSGLAPDELDHIFDEFFKADQSRHELDSSGLGLSICKRIIENHGGRIWAESAGKGHGATICFTLAAGELP